jgi:transposase
MMTVRSVNNLPAATHGETVRCLFAIELSKQSWVVAFNTPLSEKISRRTLKGCDWKGLLELIEEVRARVSRETGARQHPPPDAEIVGAEVLLPSP